MLWVVRPAIAPTITLRAVAKALLRPAAVVGQLASSTVSAVHAVEARDPWVVDHSRVAGEEHHFRPTTPSEQSRVDDGRRESLPVDGTLIARSSRGLVSGAALPRCTLILFGIELPD